MIGKQESQPHADQAQGYREQNVAGGIKPFAIVDEVQGLQAERGKRGVTAADAEHEKLRGEGARLRIHATFRTCHRPNDTDSKRAGDIDEEGAPRKGLAETAGDDARKPVAPDTAERTADCHP